MIELGRRLLLTLPVLWGVTTLTFFLLHLVPGDPVDIMLGDQASNIDRAALRHELGLDQPLLTQYEQFYKGLFSFNWGRSLHSQRPVWDEIAERLPATGELSFAAMLIAILVGIPLGIWASVSAYRWPDRVIQFVSLLGISAPSFWLGPLLILLFSIEWDLLPMSERGGWDHLILPSLTLAVGLAAVLIQTTRASMLEVLHEDYLRTARAKGLSSFRIYYKHALSNALIPVLTVLGLQMGALLTGTVLVETIFDWPGIGTLLFQAIQQRDYPLVQGCVLLIACIYVLVNLLTDLAYAWIHPQVRIS